jgi:outer membrane usher protein
LVLLVHTLSTVTLPAQPNSGPERIPISIYINKSMKGNVFASLEDPENPRVERTIIIKLLSELITGIAPKILFSEEAVTPPTISIDELRALGLEVDFDHNLLELSINIPPEQRKTAVIRLLNTPEISLDLAEKPSFFSAYVNGQTRGEYLVQWYDSGGTEVRMPLTFLLQPTVNISSWVTEGEFYFDTYPEYSASVHHIRLVKDFPEKVLRFTAGSLVFPPDGMYQPSVPLAGIGVLRDPEFSFNRKTPFSSRREILLMNPATVTVFINESPVNTFQLPPGRHVFGSFPFMSGLNTVKIEIREDGLPPRTVEYSVPFDSNLLIPGEMVYFAVLGTPQWEYGPPIASGFFRLGVLESLTFGTHLQAGIKRGIAGFEALWASPMGSIRSEAGISGGPEVPPDFGGGLQYRFTFLGKRAFPVVGLGVRYDGKTYLPPESGRQENSFGLQLTAVASRNFPGEIGANLGFGYQVGRGSQSDVLSTTLGLTKDFGNGFSLTLNLGATSRPGGVINWRGGITISSNPPREGKFFSLNHNIIEGSASADYQIHPSTPLGSPGYYFSASGLPYGDDGGGQVRGSVSYAHEKFNGLLSDTLYRGPGAAPLWANGFSWSGSSAVVFSDGQWSLSRPVQNGFAIVVPGESIADKSIRIFSGTGGETKTATQKSPAVLSDLQGYVPVQLRFDIPELPLEQEADRPLRTLAPGYKTGYLLRVNTSARMFGEGRLLDMKGKPLTLQGGDIYPLDGGTFDVQSFFTDEEGKFQFHNLKPGRYRLQLIIHEMARRDILIPENIEGLLYLGDMILPVLVKE